MSALFSPIREFIRKGDLILLTLCLAASGYGLLLIYSATRFEDNNKAILVQLIGIALGVLGYMILTFVDFQLFTEKNWKFLLLPRGMLTLGSPGLPSKGSSYLLEKETTWRGRAVRLHRECKKVRYPIVQ